MNSQSAAADSQFEDVITKNEKKIKEELIKKLESAAIYLKNASFSTPWISTIYT